ncbi:MAG: Coenzyme F420 hydrogenase/dehydrogenase, beta subunit C-terminal domain [Gemmatimonadetes bacterium]|nr:Coenzyme F420 hydrogenase/dehydrogenase, beta subunit C-terminal domain [Gemmatimonadota bacterium]
MKLTPWGPIPAAASPGGPGGPGGADVSPAAYLACPGRGLNYPELCTSVFGEQPNSWLFGCYRGLYVGYSCVPSIRRGGASGGVITQIVVYLLESGLVDGAIVVRQGWPTAWQAEPVIARSADEVLGGSQSVYVPVPVNVILRELSCMDGRFAYVGLPDQVASLRRLQQLGNPSARKIEYVLGPYVGTSVYVAALESYLRSNGISSLEEVTELRYREGEWPGYLQVKTRSGQVLRAAKFYYNYLIPFYITRSSLLSVDFTNELSDISVGDAWHPRFEKQRDGFSAVIVRSEKGEDVLSSMQAKGLLSLEEITRDEALSMHGHMLDFKKRGSFIRIGWLAAMGKPVPDYGYRPSAIPVTRKMIEVVIAGLFWLCATRPARRLVELLPLSMVGPLFEVLRRIWKRATKPGKRKGLGSAAFDVYGGRADGR